MTENPEVFAFVLEAIAMVEASVDAVNASSWFVFENDTTAIEGTGLDRTGAYFPSSAAKLPKSSWKNSRSTFQVEVLVTQLTTALAGGGAVASDGGYSMYDVLATLQKEVDALYDAK